MGASSSHTHSVSAHLAHERDWQTDIPDIKLSRAFVFVLLLHIVAVVGILAFEFFKPEMTMEPVAGTTAAEAKLAEIERAEAKKQSRRLRDSSDGYYRYTVKSGDSLEKIAARYEEPVKLFAIPCFDFADREITFELEPGGIHF